MTTKNFQVTGFTGKNYDNTVKFFIQASDLHDAEDCVLKNFPQYYYGVNIHEVDENFKNIPNGDFLCNAVRSYYEDRYRQYGIPMPV